MVYYLFDFPPSQMSESDKAASEEAEGYRHPRSNSNSDVGIQTTLRIGKETGYRLPSFLSWPVSNAEFRFFRRSSHGSGDGCS